MQKVEGSSPFIRFGVAAGDPVRASDRGGIAEFVLEPR
jgi:hypothetical protein